MLDQNTDRMWYVIGAVIVGAAIIFLVNSSFPQLFASVGDTFKGSVSEVSKTVDDISTGPELVVEHVGPNLAKPEYFTTYLANIKQYDASADTFTLDILPKGSANAWWSNGLQLEPGKVWIPFGEALLITYDIYVPENVKGIHSATDINNRLEKTVTTTNDNDVDEQRRMNGVYKKILKIPLVAGEWTKMEVLYVNNDASKNVNKERLYDGTLLGIYNDTGSNVEIQIRNINMTTQVLK